jgi:hypothetical protein
MHKFSTYLKPVNQQTAYRKQQLKTIALLIITVPTYLYIINQFLKAL